MCSFKQQHTNYRSVQTKSTLTTPTKRARDRADDGTPTKAAKPAAGDCAAGRAAAETASAAEAGTPSDDMEPMSDTDVAACSPSRPDVPSDVMDAAAALVSASSGGVHVSVPACTLSAYQQSWLFEACTVCC